MEKWQLDKDILCPNCKIYSPATCLFVPQKINNFLKIKYIGENTSKLGITETKQGTFLAKFNSLEYSLCKRYKTFQEAFIEYNKAKVKGLENFLLEYGDLLNIEVIDYINMIIGNINDKINAEKGVVVCN